MPPSAQTQKRRSRRNKKTLKNKSATSQSKQIVKLYKEVDKLKEADKQTWNYFNCINIGAQTLPAITGNPFDYGYNVIPFIDPNRLEKIFENSDVNWMTDTLRYHSSKLQMKFTINTEPDPIRITYWVVSLREEGERASALYDYGNGLVDFFSPLITTGTPTTTTNYNPITCTSTGLFWINKNIFKVHQHKSFTLCARNIAGVDVTSQYPCEEYVYYKTPHFKTPWGVSQGDVGQPGEGSSLLGSSKQAIPRHIQKYVIVVSNNLSGEGSPGVDYSILHTFSSQA